MFVCLFNYNCYMAHGVLIINNNIHDNKVCADIILFRWNYMLYDFMYPATFYVIFEQQHKRPHCLYCKN